MKLREKLQNTYERLSKGNTLTRQVLLSSGFSSDDITVITRKGILKRVGEKKGFYQLVNVDELFEYGLGCINVGNVLGALNCFLRCIEYDSTHIGANFQLFASNIESRNFKKAVSHVENIFANPDVSIEDYDFFLFLLSKILELPDNLKLHAILFKPKNVHPFDPRDCPELVTELEVINLSFEGKYEKAKSLLDSMNLYSDTKYRTISLLLGEIIRLENITSSSRNIVIKREKKTSTPFGKTVNDVFVRLMDKDYESAFGTVHVYLESIGRLEYEELIVSLITINILENNSIYYTPINILTNLDKNVFSLDIEPYIEYFKESLEQGKIPLAQAIFGVLKHSRYLDEDILEQYEQRLPKKELDSKQKEQNDTSVDIDSIYGIEGLQTIIWAVEAGISMDEAFAKLNATEEQQALVLLIFAKEFYSKSMYKEGDAYMKRVEKMHKTSLIKRTFKYLMRNKKFLRNREVDKNIPYVIFPK